MKNKFCVALDLGDVELGEGRWINGREEFETKDEAKRALDRVRAAAEECGLDVKFVLAECLYRDEDLESRAI